MPDVDNPITVSSINLFKGGASGIVAGSAVSATNYEVPWFTHEQALWGNYVASSLLALINNIPTVVSSYLVINYHVNAIDSTSSMFFSSTAYQLQKFGHSSDSSSYGIGTSGVFWTSALGYVRRLAVATDTQGICHANVNGFIIPNPGAFGVSGTPAHVNNMLHAVCLDAKDHCNRFDPTLTDL